MVLTRFRIIKIILKVKLDSFINSENNVKEDLNEIENIFVLGEKLIELNVLILIPPVHLLWAHALFDKLKLMKKIIENTILKRTTTTIYQLRYTNLKD